MTRAKFYNNRLSFMEVITKQFRCFMVHIHNKGVFLPDCANPPLTRLSINRSVSFHAYPHSCTPNAVLYSTKFGRDRTPIREIVALDFVKAYAGNFLCPRPIGRGIKC